MEHARAAMESKTRRLNGFEVLAVTASVAEVDEDRRSGDRGDEDHPRFRWAAAGAGAEVVAVSERAARRRAHARMSASASAIRGGAFGRAYIRSM